MNTFTRNDGLVLSVVSGFREELLAYRPAVTPKSNWGEKEYAAAAEKKERRLKRLAESFAAHWGALDGMRILDVGCGDGSNCFLLARHQQISRAVGIDLHLPLFADDDKGSQTRKLMARLVGNPDSTPTAHLLRMDGTRMGFQARSFDIVISRSAMEHIKPVERALDEMCRVVRAGGLIYLGIDPFFWIRGCHKRGVVDIPWAHARLSLDDYQRFVSEREGSDVSAKRRQRLETLNRLTLSQWREIIQSLPCDILKWLEKPSAIGHRFIEKLPELPRTLLPGVTVADLLTERIEVWLKRR